MATAGVPLWSTTASNNATADPAVNMAEGMAASAMNDSGRALMASVAKWRNDLYGITTGGTSTAYTIATGSTFLTAADMSGAIFTIIPHTTSGASPTLAVDSLTARALNVSTGVAVPTGALVSGTPYLVKYVHASTEFIVLGGVGSLGNTTVAGTLAVTGASTFTGAVTANGGVSSTTGAFSGVLTQSSTSHGVLASGTTAQRPGTPAAAQCRYNSTTGLPEFYSAVGWVSPGKAPTIQIFNSGTSATYTTPANVAYIRVRAVGGGGGGGGTGSGSPGTGGTGGTTTFNSISATGGTGGGPSNGNNGGAGGAGGASGAGSATLRVIGGVGSGGGAAGTSENGVGAVGGSSFFGGNGGGGQGVGPNAGVAGATNTGGGGGGASDVDTGGGGGGGGGEYFELVIGAPAATYTYSVGAAGAAGSAGTAGAAGGAGAAGRIIVDEYYA